MNVKITQNVHVEIVQRHEVTWASDDPLKFWVTVAAEDDNARTTHTMNRAQVLDLHGVLGRAIQESDAALARAAEEKKTQPRVTKKKRRSSHAKEK